MVAERGVDLGGRHFARDPATDPTAFLRLVASAEQRGRSTRGPSVPRPGRRMGDRKYCSASITHRRVREADHVASRSWKLLGKLEMVRELIGIDVPPVRRYRLTFDPVHDLSAVRATDDLRHAQAIAPRDFLTLVLLTSLFEARGMDEAEVPVLEQLGRVVPIKPEQAEIVAAAKSLREQLVRRLGDDAPASGIDWKNLSELDKKIIELLASGRVRSTAELLEQAYPNGRRPWEVSDRLGTLWLHLGKASRMPAVWGSSSRPPSRRPRRRNPPRPEWP